MLLLNAQDVIKIPIKILWMAHVNHVVVNIVMETVYKLEIGDIQRLVVVTTFSTVRVHVKQATRQTKKQFMKTTEPKVS